ncbi:MAG: alcohol dehydrogenase catalytic domain-containing protein [Pseudonocardia sp.]|uniref:zinc-dependent alcohol dehydrogenase n=1 Tax=Pseudonocardia sp. TaxID=60912 RepID=UPI001AC85A7B|nr:alcohol dehydrogenase catalytic domain-containing protein [Pseudonocardia sp.]MBN9098617.1 alcohol dehydrogenase catalytic domain-containing protein [Pseudonocardia sp.]
MRAAVTSAPGRIAVETVADPDPGPGDAVLDVGAVGLCGTDLHMYLGERHDTGFPLRQGHELGGTVAALPRGYAGSLRLGQTVTVDPAIPCGRCRPCRRGRWPACRSFRALGVALPGGLADQVVVPVGQLHDADGLSAVEAALVEPFSIAAMALARAELAGDERVLVAGGGPIGLAVTVAAVAAGHAVLVCDPLPARRTLASELGADAVCAPAELADTVAEWTGGAGTDVAVEASGTRSALDAALAAVGAGGRLVVVGVAAHDLVVPVSRVLFDGVTIVGARAGLFPQALSVVAAHRREVARFASVVYPLEDVAAAFTHAIERPDAVVKVMVAR